jgi:hypothetical protein
MVSALEIIGADWPEIRHDYRYCNSRKNRATNTVDGVRKSRPFWVRNEDSLYEIAVEARRAYLRSIKQVKHDFDENKEESQAVIAAYDFIKRKLKERGVVL